MRSYDLHFFSHPPLSLLFFLLLLGLLFLRLGVGLIDGAIIGTIAFLGWRALGAARARRDS